MSQLALTLELTGLDPAAAEDACFDAGALAVTLTDAADDAILEPKPGEERLWPRTVLQALFAADAATPALVAHLAREMGIEASRFTLAAVTDRPWEREWLKDFHAMRFGERLWIVPHHEPPPPPPAVVVRLDPGLAFGTGTHPSTALCLAWLDGRSRPPVRPSSTTAAVRACSPSPRPGSVPRPRSVTTSIRRPASRRATMRQPTASRPSCGSCDEPAALPDTANVLLANIISGTLCELAPSFARMLRPGATLVLAGILDEQADEVIATYARWFFLAPWQRRDGWTALAGTRCSPPAPAAR